MKCKRMMGVLLFCCIVCNAGIIPEMACKAAEERWVSVSYVAVDLSFSGTTATCDVEAAGYSNVKTIAGTLKLTYISNSGIATEIESWYISSDRNLDETRYATIGATGTYYLSFSGTATMTDGKTETVSASRTRIY